jgi:SAM-dependent methyltransferase
MSHQDPKSTERFSDRVDNYARYRPTYPAEVVDILAKEIGLEPSWRIADVGSGTGISAELFLRNGNSVYGVEPNAPMREAAERLLAGYVNFTSINGTAEATTLPDRCVDLVLAAQAFHWFDVAAFRMEAKRVLKPGGWAVLMWNTRQLEGTPFLRAYEQFLIEHGTDYLRVRHDHGESTKLVRFFGGPYQTRRVPNRQRLSRDGLRGRLLSASYVPGPTEPGHDAAVEAIDRLFDEHEQNGEVLIEYDMELHFSQLA